MRGSRTRGTVAAAGAVAGALAIVLLLPLAGATPSGASPDASRSAAKRYIVTLDDSVSDPAAVGASQLARSSGAAIQRVYVHALKGYVADLTKRDIRALKSDSRVRSIDRDTVVTLSATQPNPPSWGIDRVDQRNLPLSNSYNYTATGSGVRAYIIDTGIRATHTDIAGRVVAGVNTVDATPSTTDCNGHGTHVSGTVGGTTYGVAKAVTLVAVRVFGCGSSTTTAAIIAGVDWVTGNHVAGQPAVANMSLGGSANTALDTAVRNMILDGVSTAIAAGNGNALGMPANSCNQSPGRVAEGITVGASTRTDAAASFSNYGTCVDLFGPGVDIVSAGIASDTASATLSGTSMASPHVAGVAAQYLQLNPGATAAQVQAALKANSTKDVITGTAGGFFGGSTPNNDMVLSY